MSIDLSTGVLVVGAGPTGLTLAAELARRGVPCRLIDKATERSPYSKAVAIQARTLETLTLMRAVDEFLERGHRLTGGNVYSNGKHIIRLTFDGLDTPYPYILTLPQPETERILTELCASHGVEVEHGVALTSFTQDDDCVAATLTHADGTTESVRAAWMVGCDGARSVVREQLGTEFEGHTYPQIFALADLDIAWNLPDDAAQVFTENGDLCGIFPFGNGRYRIVADNPPWAADGYTPSIAEWQAMVDARSHVSSVLGDMRWTTTFHVNSRLVKQMRTGRVFLAGDAAHIHSPAGGQGMNTGIQDAVNLAWKLALVQHGIAPVLLDSYERERFPVERGVLRQTDFLINLVGAHGGMAAVLRDHVAPVVSKLDVVQRSAGRLVSEIAIRYRNSEIVEDHQLRGGPAAGDRAPDAFARVISDGRIARVMTLCARREHTLLALVGAESDEDTHTRCEALVAERVPELLRDSIVPMLITDVAPNELPSSSDPSVHPPRSLRDEYGSMRPVMYLIRPDGYVAFRSTLDSGGEVALCRYLEGLVLGGVPEASARVTAPPAC